MHNLPKLTHNDTNNLIKQLRISRILMMSFFYYYRRANGKEIGAMVLASRKTTCL